MHSDPYRTMNFTTQRRLPRLRARLRTLYWRAMAPAKVVGVLVGMGLFINLAIKVDTDTKLLNGEAHLRGWEKALDARQAKLDEDEKQDAVKTGTLDMKLREVDFTRSLQLPLMIKGTYEEYPVEFHDLAVVRGEAKPVVCYMDRTGMDVTLKCVANRVAR